MTALLSLRSATLAVWGEPTVCDIGVCATPFQRDGSVAGEVGRWFGGSAFATAIGAARRGAAVRFHGPFGTDAEGRGALAFAVAQGVTVQPIDAGESRRTLIVVDVDGTRSMVGGAGHAFVQPWADRLERLDGGVSHVSLSSVVRDHTGAVERLLQRSACGVLSLDAGSVGAIREIGARRLGALVGSAEKVLMFANADEARELRASCPEVLDALWCFVERDGANGATAHVAGSSVSVPAVEHVVVVDTTGAGDAFAAGFLTKWISGVHDVAEALSAAHRSAAEVVARVGTV